MRSLLCVLVLLSLGCPAWAEDQKPLPEPRPAAPAFLNVVTFAQRLHGESQKIVVTSGTGLLRVDLPNDGYSIIYDAATDHYTGLEHRNYTWWEFSWPDVRSVVQSSKRFATHLEELNAEGAGEIATGSPSSGSLGDNSGYVWKQGTEKKQIAGLDCTLWTGDSLSGEAIQAWCASGTVPKIQEAMQQLRKINEPIALVPVRDIVSSTVFPAYDALVKGGVTPVLLTWGGNLDKNRFGVDEIAEREGKMSLFEVPKLYVKTTLITMDGLYEEVQKKEKATR